MSININASFPNLNNFKIDINKIFEQRKMKPSGTLSAANTAMTYETQDSIDAENYQAGLSVSSNSGKISLTENEKIFGLLSLSSKDSAFTDPQFIDNFAAKESFYEDTIKSKYSGEELQEKLDDLHKVSDETLNKLSEEFANGIGNFMNGTSGWLYEEYTDTAGVSSQSFDVNEFKNHVVDVVKNEEKIFNDIKSQNPDEWEQIIDNHGNGLENFTAKLQSISSSNSTTSNKFEDMSYSDINALGTIIHSLGGGEYTNSASDLGAYLGQMKLKGDIMIQTSNMSSELKHTLSNAISKNIATKIATFSNSHSSIGGEKEVLDSFDSFAKLSNISLQQFRTEYSNSLNKLKNSSLKGVSDSCESPYSNAVRFANDVITLQTNDWNSFVDKLNLSNNTKKYLYISSVSGNSIDARS